MKRIVSQLFIQQCYYTIMKKGLFIIGLLCLLNSTTKAQLYVDVEGHTAVGDWNFTQGVFSVSTNTGSQQPQIAFIKSTESGCALEVCNFTPNNYLSYQEEIVGTRVFSAAQQYRRAIGIKTSSYPANSGVSCSTIGLMASAGDGTSGYNYGINTYLSGTQNGTGLFAASSSNYTSGIDVGGKWAGYFQGDVKVVGYVTATAFTTTSDYRLKENIRQIESRSLDKLMNLNVVRYKLKNYQVNMSDTVSTKPSAYDLNSPLLKTDHYGLIAQELKEIYPELIIEGEDGFLSINYIELIPILIKTVQELNTKVDLLECNSASSPVKGPDNINAKEPEFQPILYQNNPNPFTESTIIKCLIPQEVSDAVLYIYDINGHQINNITISERGETSIKLDGNTLYAGIFLYSLITDGIVVDTKRLILTK